MVKLTESIVVGRTKATNLTTIKKLNVWGCDIDDISLVADMPALEVLSLSVNNITSIAGIAHCHNLRELYMRKNCVDNLDEVDYLRGLRKLRVLWMDENPIADMKNYRMRVLRACPNLSLLDNRNVSREEVAFAMTLTDEDLGIKSPESTFYSSRNLQDRCDSTDSNHSSVHDLHIVHDVITEKHTPHSEYIEVGEAAAEQTTPVYEEYIHYEPALMTNSIHSQSGALPNIMSQSLPQDVARSYGLGRPSRTMNTIDETWHDFPSPEHPHPPQRIYIPVSARSRRVSPRSVSLPRGTLPRSRSTSPSRFIMAHTQRADNVLTAIRVLLDELDQDSLRTVVVEANQRIKKQL